MAADGSSVVEDVVRNTAAQGRVIDFSRPDDKADQLPPFDDARWDGRSIDGSWLAEFLATSGKGIHHRGVRIRWARILSGLDLSAATVAFPLELENCHFGENPLVLNDARMRSVLLPGSVCGGVIATNTRFDGNLHLNRRFRTTGAAFLFGVTIEGNLACNHGRFEADRDPALAFDNAKVSGNVFLAREFRATACVRLTGATIGGNLECTGGKFCSASLGAKTPEPALAFDNADVKGNVYLTKEFEARGEVRLTRAKIDGNLECSGGSFLEGSPDALSCNRAQVGGTVVLREPLTVEGTVVLAGARAGALRDDQESWPARMRIDGFRFDDLRSDQRGWKERRAWLKNQVSPHPQGYLQLAQIYRSNGEYRDARKILMERHNVLLRPPSHWVVERRKGVRGVLDAIARSWRWVGRAAMRYTIGHGYEPWRALLPAVILIAAMTWWYTDARSNDLLVPSRAGTSAAASKCERSYPCMEPYLYAIDNLVPLVDFGQRSAWSPDASRSGRVWYESGVWLARATWFGRALGWILATLVAAGFTQAIRRE